MHNEREKSNGGCLGTEWVSSKNLYILSLL